MNDDALDVHVFFRIAEFLRLRIHFHWYMGDAQDHAHTGDDARKLRVIWLCIQDLRRFRSCADEKLTAVRVRAGVCHGHNARRIWVVDGQFIGEFVTWAAGAILFRIAGLNHVRCDDPKEFVAIVKVVQRQKYEVVDRMRCQIGKQRERELAIRRVYLCQVRLVRIDDHGRRMAEALRPVFDCGGLLKAGCRVGRGWWGGGGSRHTASTHTYDDSTAHQHTVDSVSIKMAHS